MNWKSYSRQNEFLRMASMRELQSAAGEELSALHREIDLVYFVET